ncbi:TetR/AcrR family transcriptional regulator [bacterium]|nr:TetR/AcrR family transcriptional regulator [bacterium]
MTQEEKQAARTRILKTAVSLFARKGYAAVGVREIAAQAEVNISMISYYFNGKVGILAEIVDEFWENYHRHIVKAMDRGETPEIKIHAITGAMVDYVRENKELALVAFHTMPLEIPEIANLKQKSLMKIMGSVQSLIASLGLDINDLQLFSIIGPAIMSLIVTHFRLRDFQAKVFDINFDDAFYERYKIIIATLLLEGVQGLARLPKSNTEKNA